MNHEDIVYQIFNFLELKDILTCLVINKLINKVCDLQYARLLRNDYAKVPKPFLNKRSHKQSYILCYELDIFRKKNYTATDSVDFFRQI
jgi:hypothetical protein